MEKSKFIFPVEEVKVQFLMPAKDDSDLATWTDTMDYKAIIRTDNNKLISIVKDSYSLVSNETVLNNTVGILESLNLPYYIDPLNSHCSDERMVCHAIFKNIVLNDGGSPIHLSMFIHNSYDGSQKFRFRFGTYRLACSNGALIGYTALGTIFRKHTAHFVVEDTIKTIQDAVKAYPTLQERIEELQLAQINLLKFKPIAEKIMGKSFVKYMKDTKGWRNIQTFYDLYLEMTWFVSHKVTPIMKEYYFERIGKAFKI